MRTRDWVPCGWRVGSEEELHALCESQPRIAVVASAVWFQPELTLQQFVERFRDQTESMQDRSFLACSAGASVCDALLQAFEPTWMQLPDELALAMGA